MSYHDDDISIDLGNIFQEAEFVRLAKNTDYYKKLLVEGKTPNEAEKICVMACIILMMSLSKPDST